MNRRQFLITSTVVGIYTAVFKRVYSRNVEVKKNVNVMALDNGLPACLPFCLTSSENYQGVSEKRYEVYLPMVSRPTSTGNGQIVTVPRRRLLKFWERYD